VRRQVSDNLLLASGRSKVMRVLPEFQVLRNRHGLELFVSLSFKTCERGSRRRALPLRSRCTGLSKNKANVLSLFRPHNRVGRSECSSGRLQRWPVHRDSRTDRVR